MRLEIADGWVDFDRPRNATALLVLTHGAGTAIGTSDVLAVRAAAIAHRIAVALVTQPYRVAGRRTPPTPARQDEAWLAVLAGFLSRRNVSSLPLVVGGRSNGARVACRTATALGARGVVAIAYPVHPPGKPDISRLDELELPDVPVLVVQGSRDPYGMPPPAPGRTVHVVEGANHSLRTHFESVPEVIVQFVTSSTVRASV